MFVSESCDYNAEVINTTILISVKEFTQNFTLTIQSRCKKNGYTRLERDYIFVGVEKIPYGKLCMVKCSLFAVSSCNVMLLIF